MSGSSVIYLKAHSRTETLVPDAPRVVAALGNALLRPPPKPPGLAACVAYLQEAAEQLLSRQMGLRALQNLRTALFTAPGREAEMALMWREALATACFARVIAVQTRFDAPLLTGAGLLHRAGEIAALRALAAAERETGQRLVGPVMNEILAARDDELVARVTRCWALPAELRLLILRWREEQHAVQRPESVSLLIMAQALATERVHAATCTPGLVDVAREALQLPAAVVDCARAAAQGIEALLAQVAPAPAPAVH
jgi:HD-like signal output (HDOD) protein